MLTKNQCEQFTCNGKQSHAAVIGTHQTIALSFLKWENNPVAPVIRSFLMNPYFIDNLGQPSQDRILAIFDQLSSYTTNIGSMAILELTGCASNLLDSDILYFTWRGSHLGSSHPPGVVELQL
ncbi:hypothetical protein KIL84_017568 [Mauremys mutica]|uniref:Uncharacterized protein n=1 Tax=Mauremys mutica TaxID=74926 RepID=A0A9D4AXL2_9SAUR|nr:hypothetical protein KIL84_017568 [Mauremys mutica]